MDNAFNLMRTVGGDHKQVVVGPGCRELREIAGIEPSYRWRRRGCTVVNSPNLPVSLREMAEQISRGGPTCRERGGVQLNQEGSERVVSKKLSRAGKDSRLGAFHIDLYDIDGLVAQLIEGDDLHLGLFEDLARRELLRCLEEP